MHIDMSVNVVHSVSFQVGPYDSRCRSWAKVIRADVELPLPSVVEGADDIPAPYHRWGEEELFSGDIVFEGESNHHRRRDRGWTYWVHFVNAEGKLLTYRSGFGEQKTAAKQLGLPKELLAGAGDHAGAIRVAHALRAGMKLPGALRM